MNRQNSIYFDYAASTPVDPMALEAMLPYFKDFYGNTGGVHRYAQQLSEQLENQRALFAENLRAKPAEIIFTSSATESNNTIIKGVARSLQAKGKHILISEIEHPSVYQPAQYLKQQGFDVQRIPVTDKGILESGKIEKLIRADTILVSVMHVNNETGVIQPIEEISSICKQKDVLLHTDAAQSLGKITIDLSRLPIDYLSASSHKIYGPPGSALLYCRSGSPYLPLLHGGGQEDGRRSSTVNIPGITGFGAAFKIASHNQKEEWKRLAELRKLFTDKLYHSIPEVQINGDERHTIPGIISVSFKGTDAEILSMQLNRQGFAVSTGSACSSGSIKESPVLKAMGIDTDWIKGTIRFSTGRYTGKDEIESLFRILPDLVQKVRKIR